MKYSVIALILVLGCSKQNATFKSRTQAKEKTRSAFKSFALGEPLHNFTGDLVQVFDPPSNVFLTGDQNGNTAVYYEPNDTIGFVDMENERLLNCFNYSATSSAEFPDIIDCEDDGSLFSISSGATYSNGQLLRSGNNFFHENGSTMFNGSDWFYENGSVLYQSPTSLRWQNGQTMRSGNTLRYPNGNTLRSGSTLRMIDGDIFVSGTNYDYIDGSVLRSGDRYDYDDGVVLFNGSEIFYPNGNTLRKSNGQVFFDNGNQAGSIADEFQQPNGFVSVDADSNDFYIGIFEEQGDAVYLTQIFSDDFVAPPLVSNLQVTSRGQTTIDLSWNSGGGNTSHYKVAWQVGTLAPSSCSSGTEVFTESYTITALLAGTNYGITVCSVGNNGIVSSGVEIVSSTKIFPVLHTPDVNGDGIKDAVFIADGNEITLDLNVEDGIQEVNSSLILGGTYALGQIQFADINGDGRDDLIRQTGDNDFYLSLSNGSDFGPQSLVLNHGGNFVRGQAHYYDFNNDGRDDVLLNASLPGFTQNAFWVSLSTGSSFSSPSNWLTHGGPFEFGRANFGDVNGDNLTDVIYIGGTANGTVGFYVSLSNGASFNPPVLALEHGGQFSAGLATFADYDGDSRIDIAYLGGADNDVDLWMSYSNGLLFSPPVLGIEHGGDFNKKRVRAGDVNGDGQSDIVYLGGFNQAKLWISLSTGRSFAPAAGSTTFPVSYLNNFHFDEFTGDALLDAVVQSGDEVYLAEGGLLGFDSGAEILKHGGSFIPSQVQYADFNGDGFEDLMLESIAGPNQVNYWVSYGDGITLTPPALALSRAGQFRERGTRYHDMDGDGKADIIYMEFTSSGSVGFHYAKSTGSGFSAANMIVQHGGTLDTWRAHFADFNADSRTDLLYEGGTASGGVGLYLSHFNGTSLSAPSLAIQHGGNPNIPGRLNVVDIENDGRADVVYTSGSPSGNLGFWLSKNTGSGFSSPTLSLEHGGGFVAGKTHFIDVNNDGTEDVVYESGTASGATGYWVSLWNGVSFNAPYLGLERAGGFTPGTSRFIDFNNDGLIDLFWLSGDSSSTEIRSYVGNGISFQGETLSALIMDSFHGDKVHFTNFDNSGFAEMIFQTSNNAFNKHRFEAQSFGPAEQIK